MELTYINPITNEEGTIKISEELSNIGTRLALSRLSTNTALELCESFLEDLDCSKLCCGKQVISLNSFRYKSTLDIIYFYARRLNDERKYNDIINKLINKHIENIIFESNIIKGESIIKTKKRIVKAKTKDLFTGKEEILNIDNKTGEIIKDKPKRKRENKVASIPLSAMVFKIK